MDWLKRYRRAGQVVLLVALFCGGVGVRRHVLNAQRELTADGSIPFTLESALAFRRIQLVYRDGELPRVDRGVEYPEGVVSQELDTMGAERVYARVAKATPGLMPLAEQIRWMHVLWFCLAIPGVYFWVKWMGGGAWGGAAAAALYAVSISAVARSTGQELSHENHALPFLVWHLAAEAWRQGRAVSWKQRLAAGGAGAVLLALVLAAWDLVQFYLVLLFVWHGVRALRGRFSREELWTWAVPLMAVLAAAGWRNPYLRAHGFLASLVMMLGWGMLLAATPLAQRGRWATRLVLWAVPVLAGIFLLGRLVPAYGHFGSLLWAKLRFLNVRPTDPSLLTFEQRMLWVPALNSTSWELLWRWFPALLVLTAVAGCGVVKRNRRDESVATAVFPLLFYLIASFGTFILFFRFHVWVALFACGVAGWWAGQLPAIERAWRRRGAAALVLLVLALEGAQPLMGPLERQWNTEAARVPEARKWNGPLFWGRPNVYADETEALMTFLRMQVAPEPVLANFGISGSIAAYGGCPVVLHPKFETRQIRERVEAYGEALFKGTEPEFQSWMEAHGATVYVHSMGEFSEMQPGYQMRFMVNAMNPAEDAPARLFEQAPEKLECFTKVFENRKYRVYRLKQSPLAARLAQTRADEGREALEQGRLQWAMYYAGHALAMDAECGEAQEVLRIAMNLKDAGFAADELEDVVMVSPLAPADAW